MCNQAARKPERSGRMEEDGQVDSGWFQETDLASIWEAPSATQMEFYLLAGPGSLGWEVPCGGDSIASNLTPRR